MNLNFRLFEIDFWVWLGGLNWYDFEKSKVRFETKEIIEFNL